jgi:hypothetical protein
VARRGKRNVKAQRALVAFARWFESGLDTSIQNVRELKKVNPPGIQNPVLRFAVPRAMNYVVERFVIEVVQAWELMNEELQRQGRRTLGSSNKHFRHLKRIRNKLIAHKVENTLRTKRHENWYKRTYGSYESVLGLVRQVSECIYTRIRELEMKRQITGRNVAVAHVPKFEVKDIEALLGALKSHGIY